MALMPPVRVRVVLVSALIRAVDVRVIEPGHVLLYCTLRSAPSLVTPRPASRRASAKYVVAPVGRSSSAPPGWTAVQALTVLVPRDLRAPMLSGP